MRLAFLLSSTPYSLARKILAPCTDALAINRATDREVVSQRRSDKTCATRAGDLSAGDGRVTTGLCPWAAVAPCGVERKHRHGKQEAPRLAAHAKQSAELSSKGQRILLPTDETPYWVTSALGCGEIAGKTATYAQAETETAETKHPICFI